jgi:chromosomal replication initiator protein
MVTLEERLRSRFEWGLIVDIQPPNFETRLAILQTKAEQLGADIPNDVLEFIAANIERNIRELEGALNQLLAMTRLTGQSLSLDTTQNALADLLPNPPELSSEEILKAVADYYNLTVKDLRGARRTRRIALPRQIAMYLIREETDASYPQIGAQLGGRDHTTILYGYERINSQIEEDSQLRREIMTLKSQLYERN